MTAAKALETLAARRQTLACAESLTGGLLCDALVSVPGASRVFMGGIVAYDEGRKVSLLGVSAETLRRHTAVSGETAREMAEGARARLGVDYALSTTGYAGPDGEDVGLVYIACADAAETVVRQRRFNGDRSEIRRAAARAALDLLAEQLEKTKESNHG